MEWVITKINREVEDLMWSYKKSTSEFRTSLEKIQDNAKKSIGELSLNFKDMEDLQALASHKSHGFPRI